MAVMAAACAAVLTVVLVQRAAPPQSPLLGARVARPSSTAAALRLSTRAAPPQMMPIKEFSRKKRYVNSFNDNGFLNVIMPLTPRHFSDVTKLDLYSARVRCENCTCGFVQAQGGYALCNSAREQLAARQEGWDRWITAFYFGSWYLLSIGHSVFNKKVTNVLPLPWCVATAQIVVGALLVCGMWATGLRERPKMSRAALRTMLPIGALHAIGHVSGVVGTTWGSVSFAQVVKSAGPVYACVLSSLVLKQAVSLRVWLSLLPILSGVLLATTSELSFAWAALGGAVVSDLAFAFRNIYSKLSMNSEEGSTLETMSAANTFAVTTCVAAVAAVPFALGVEGARAAAAWTAAAPTAAASVGLLGQVLLTGLYFYGYSEVAMKALKNVHPVTHAIGNTMRRVVIMLICIAVFRTPVSLAGGVGSAVAIGGSYLYAMVKSQEKAEAEAAAAAAEEAG